MKTASRKDAAAQQDGGGQALGGLTARQHGERFADTRREGQRDLQQLRPRPGVGIASALPVKSLHMGLLMQPS